MENLKEIFEDVKVNKKAPNNSIVSLLKVTVVCLSIVFIWLFTVVCLTGDNISEESTKAINYDLYSSSNIILWDDTAEPTEEGITFTVYKMLDNNTEYLIIVSNTGNITVEEIN